MIDLSARRRVEPDDLLAIKGVADAQLSPDGAQLAFLSDREGGAPQL